MLHSLHIGIVVAAAKKISSIVSVWSLLSGSSVFIIAIQVPSLPSFSLATIAGIKATYFDDICRNYL
jgi:hypothetical protein